MAYSTHQNSDNRNTPTCVIVTELPINGHLSLDGAPLYISQEVVKEDVPRLIFTAAQGEKSDTYGNLKLIVNDAEQCFTIDADIINEALKIEEIKEALMAAQQSQLQSNTAPRYIGTKAGNNNTNPEDEEEKNTLAFISKRKSDFDLEHEHSNWLSATNLDMFEDE